MLVISHDRSFLNEVSSDMLHLHSQKLTAYRGNYDSFVKSMEERLTQQQRDYDAQMELRAHTQQFIDKFRFNAKRASMVQSRIKMIEKLPILESVQRDAPVVFQFPEVSEKLAPPVLRLDDVSFAYSKDSRALFEHLDCNATSDSRICIVGDNGAGKTTLLKILLGQLEPTSGFRQANRRATIGYFAQHHVDQLDDLDASAVELCAKRHPGLTSEQYRTALGRFGVSGDLATRSISSLSGGQKSRLAFALLGLLRPNFLIMDEPTNHLDVDTVEALGNALLKFSGGVLLVSHDERLIQMFCQELWVVADRKVSRIEGGLKEYKRQIAKQMELQI